MKKNSKRITILPIILAFIIVIIFVIIHYASRNDLDYKVSTFKHKDIDTLKLKEGTFWADDSSDEKSTFYYYAKKDVDHDGRYFAGEFIFPNRIRIVIEENVLKDGGPNDPEYFKVESILYSEYDLTKEHVETYLTYMHVNPCGPVLDEFKEIKENYYFVKYTMADEC